MSATLLSSRPGRKLQEQLSYPHALTRLTKEMKIDTLERTVHAEEAEEESSHHEQEKLHYSTKLTEKERRQMCVHLYVRWVTCGCRKKKEMRQRDKAKKARKAKMGEFNERCVLCAVRMRSNSKKSRQYARADCPAREGSRSAARETRAEERGKDVWPT